MRARYYEAGSGRFIIEDQCRHGWNWCNYCSNDPVNQVDSSGNLPDWTVTLFHSSVTAFQLWKLFQNSMISKAAAVVAMAGLAFLAAWFGDLAYGNHGLSYSSAVTGAGLSATFSALYGLILESMGTDTEANSVASRCIATVQNYMLILLMFIRLEFFVGDG